ncbi:MAG: hypothetical protein WA148_07750 [Actinomycetota bacterium]
MVVPIVVFDLVGEFFTLFPILGAALVLALVITMIIVGGYGFYESRHVTR